MEDHFKSRFIVWNFVPCCFLADTNLGRITGDHRNTTPKATALGGKFLRYHKYPFSSRTRLEAFGVVRASHLQSGRGGAAPVAATRHFSVSIPPVLSACHQIRIFHFVTLFQSADRFFSPGCESPPCVEEEVPSTKLSLATIPEFHLTGPALCIVGTDRRVINQGPLSPFSSPKFALAFVDGDAHPVDIWIHFGSKRGECCTTPGELCSSSCSMMKFS